MNIVTWNVNSLKARTDFVAKYLDEAEPDVLGIQELKLEATKVPSHIFTERGYHVAMHAQKTWNGVLLASKEPLENEHRGFDGEDGQARLVAATTGGIDYVNLYCPQGQRVDSPKFEYKLGFYDALISFLEQRRSPEVPMVVMGDLNIAPESDDIWDPEGFRNVPSFHPLEHERWRRLLDLGFHDVVKPRLKEVRYSFWDYRGGCFHKNQGMRIDHILVTEHLLERADEAWIERGWRKKKDDLAPSDHAPVTLSLK